MDPFVDCLKAFRHLIRTSRRVLLDLLKLIGGMCRSMRAVEGENLFLRKQLALFQERKTKARRADDSTRWVMSFLSQGFDWRNALILVKPETLIRWHRKGFRLFWRWKSRTTGRPRLPKDLLALILQMARENPTWGQEHIASELKLKLGIRVSLRTVGKYLAQQPRRKPDPSQRWLTFVRNHAQSIVACDFFVVVTARFRILYVFVLMELSRRRILHYNVTDHPSSDWTLQQLRAQMIIRTGSSSMTGTASSPRNWTKPLPPWVCAYCGRLFDPPKPTPDVNVWSERSAASA